MQKAFWFKINLFLLNSRSSKTVCCFCFQPNFKNLPILKQMFLSSLHAFKNSLNVLLVLRSMFLQLFHLDSLWKYCISLYFFLLKHIILKNIILYWLIMIIKYLRKKNSVKIPEFQFFNYLITYILWEDWRSLHTDCKNSTISLSNIFNWFHSEDTKFMVAQYVNFWGVKMQGIKSHSKYPWLIPLYKWMFCIIFSCCPRNMH